MENKEENMFMYYENGEGWNQIDEKWLKSPEKLLEYGNWDDDLDVNNEIVIYKLVPYKKLKKNIKYEFV